jgi:hypothetical protein
MGAMAWQRQQHQELVWFALKLKAGIVLCRLVLHGMRSCIGSCGLWDEQQQQQQAFYAEQGV